MSSSSKIYECLKGWLLAPSPTDGTNVPFFVHVRGKDIVWDESGLPADIIRLSDIGTDKSTETPATQLKFTYNDWHIVAHNDYSFEAVRKIPIGGSGFNFYKNDNTDLYLNLRFPFVALFDNELSINCTLSGLNEEIATASVNVLFDAKETDETISEANIHLRNLIYKFHDKFENMDTYMNSYIYVSLKGKMRLDNI